MIWLRGTFPRFRYDQLMNIGWKYMIPIGMGAILVNAVVGMLLSRLRSGSPMAARGRQLVVLAVLLAALVPAAILAWKTRHFEHLGYFHDDGMYWIGGKSLAEGHGYRILSLPDTPFQTKYPPLYPLLLALVWKVFPVFPGNLPWAHARDVDRASGFCGGEPAPARILGLFALERHARVRVDGAQSLRGLLQCQPDAGAADVGAVGGLLSGGASGRRARFRPARARRRSPGGRRLSHQVGRPAASGGRADLVHAAAQVPAGPLVSGPSRRRGRPLERLERAAYGPVLGRVAIYYTSYLGDYLNDLRPAEWLTFLWQNIPTFLASIGNLLIPDVAEFPLLGRYFSQLLALFAMAGILRQIRRDRRRAAALVCGRIFGAPARLAVSAQRALSHPRFCRCSSSAP